jgi:hypothetical protein
VHTKFDDYCLGDLKGCNICITEGRDFFFKLSLGWAQVA